MKFLFRRRYLFFLFAFFLTAALFYMNYIINSIGIDRPMLNIEKEEVDSIKRKIVSLEQKAAENEKNLQNLQETYKKLLPSNTSRNEFEPNENTIEIGKNKKYSQQCDWYSEQKPKSSDIELSDVIENLSFDDIDGGVWKQGFDITYDANQWTNDKKLNIIIIPHSHNDPGWIMTFEEYFSRRTKNILDTVVNSLSEKINRKFIWAETSYLSLWWESTTNEMRSKLKRLVLETKQLEIVTGGWVMTDEANSHYYAMIEEMIEGHEWLKANIDPSIRPNYGWSIDPFGYTPTMAYLLKQMGFDGMLIQRVHYHLKKYMAKNQRFEFMWRQSWSTVNSKDTSIYCHVMPFYSYDIPHTCGPDPKICCQFDFKRLDGRIMCPWGIQPKVINDKNVEERASLLLDQYRKKSQLYGDKQNHNVLLVVLGDDFRYQDMTEANDQFDNYDRLITYMNSRSDWNVNVKFGTLSEYFDLLKKYDKLNNKKLESFTGDFFTYADRQDHYWSGYFTSRAFYKRLNRLVEHYLRTAEILFSLTNLIQTKNDIKFTRSNDLYKDLLISRRYLALFQHHDAIAGTAKAYVVLDYANKLYLALKNCKNIIEYTASYLTSESATNENIFNIDDIKLNSNKNEKSDYVYINLSDTETEKKLVLINTNLNRRNELVSIRVNDPHVDIIDKNGQIIGDYQLNLIWPNTDMSYLNDMSSSLNNIDLSYSLDFEEKFYELIFESNLDPMSITTYKIRKRLKTEEFKDKFSRVMFYTNSNLDQTNVLNYQTNINKKLNNSYLNNFKIEYSKLSNGYIKIDAGQNQQAYFSSMTGLLTEIGQIKTNIKLFKYGTTSAREKSGAYLFIPDGPATEIDQNLFQWIRVESGGTLRNRVCVNMTLVLHCVEFYPSMTNLKEFKIPYFSAWNVVDLRQSNNYELVMKINTDIKNNDFIHTDLNGFQYTKRKHYDKLTIQGNVYPMPSGAFIQDNKLRLNILTASPLGVGSLEHGSIQVFLDRRLNQDDNRGMEEAMMDNVVVSNRFIIFYESINNKESAAIDHPSLMSQMMSFDLLNPIVKLLLKKSSSSIIKSINYIQSNIPCDLRLVNMRTMQNKDETPMMNHVGLILHRVNYEDCSNKQTVQLSTYLNAQCSFEGVNKFKFEDLFKYLFKSNMYSKMNIKNTYLTMSYKNDERKIRQDETIFDHLEPMQIEAFRINFIL